MNIGVRIVGTGSYVPDRILTNHDLEQLVDTSDEWIRTRTGIRERRIAADDEPTSALATAAARRALEAAGLEASALDLIIVATFTPDQPFPNTACFVQQQLGVTGIPCFSIEAACSGFTYVLEIAAALIRTGAYRTVLIIGAEKLSSMLNWEDRTTCVLFGDGAGAAIMQACPAEENACISSCLGADGTYTGILQTPAGGARIPVTAEVLEQRLNTIKMSGQEVFKLAVTGMANAAKDALEKGGVEVEQLRWLVPHQANNRIISAVAKRLQIPDEKVYVNVEKYGNTSAASIPIALDEMVRGGLVERGDYLLFVAFGGGLTWGANLILW